MRVIGEREFLLTPGSGSLPDTGAAMKNLQQSGFIEYSGRLAQPCNEKCQQGNAAKERDKCRCQNQVNLDRFFPCQGGEIFRHAGV